MPQRTLLLMLLVLYLASLQGVDAGVVLKYLVPLYDKGKIVKEQVCIYIFICYMPCSLAK